MSRLQFKKERVHFLSSLLAIKDVKKLRDEANWAGTGEASRLDLLRKIQAEVVSSQMIPDHRLEALLDDAMKVQKSRRAYRNSFSKSLSLLEHFSDTRDCIPNRTVQVLRGHSDEVWYVSFSHNGKYLASASKVGNVLFASMYLLHLYNVAIRVSLMFTNEHYSMHRTSRSFCGSVMTMEPSTWKRGSPDIPATWGL